jgi:hypothetical protein
MYRILNFYIIVFSILLLKMNSKMVKSGMMVLTERVKADVAMSWILQAAGGAVVDEREREN